jgi:putative restriction endonuclease
VLVESYFAPDVRSTLAEVGQIASESFEYSRELLDRSRGRFKVLEAPDMDEQYHTESRSTAFRRVVVQAYNHTCAMCGIRVVTPEGRTAVAAAHIVPWSVSHNDDPRNGMALCGLHHWTFDQGMVGVTPDYQIRISPAIPAEEAAEPLLSLADRKLRRPTDQIIWPAKPALRWHLEHVFRAEAPTRLL